MVAIRSNRYLFPCTNFTDNQIIYDMNKLTTLIVLAMLLAFCSSPEQTDTTPAVAEDPLLTKDLGVQMYSFRNIVPEIGMVAMLDEIKNMGITEIETRLPEGLSAEDYRQMIEERGLNIVSVGTNYNQLTENLEEIAELAKSLEAEFVMLPWFPHENGFHLDDAEYAVEVFNNAGQYLSEHGLTFKYHPHGYEMREHEDGTLLDYIIQHTDPEVVSFQLDVFWVYFGGGDPAEYLRNYHDRFVSLHLKDMQHGVERDLSGRTDNEYNVVLGTGEINMEEIVRTAVEIGIEHYFIEDESSRVMEQIPHSVAWLKSLEK